MKILLVEDDVETAAFIMKGLAEAGYIVEHACDGEDGLLRIRTDSYDVIIADVMLPKVDGWTMIAEMRKRKIHTSTIILSARTSVDDRIKGLETGADDYLVKPFAFSELLARVQVLLRRNSRTAEPTQLTVGDLTLDLLARRVVRQGQRIDLQPREFALLEYLMRNADRVVSKTMIIQHVWEFDFDPQTNIVEVRMSRLRDKIDRPFGRNLLHTIRGAGYVIREEV